jgi:Tfp pilus assembly protein PilN
MPSVNLIASRRVEKRRQRQNIRKLTYVTMAELGLVVLAISFMSLRLVSVNGHVADLNDQIRKLEPTVSEIASLQTETTHMLPKVTVLDNAKADTLFWYKNMITLTDSLPPKTWLTSVTTGGTAAAAGGAPVAGAVATAADPPTFNITGVAIDQASVGEAMLRINSAATMDHADLSFVQQQKIGTVDTTAFQMTVHVKPENRQDPVKGEQDAKNS